MLYKVWCRIIRSNYSIFINQNIFSLSDATVTVNPSTGSVVPPKNIEIKCSVTGAETFDGWYRDGTKITDSSSALVRVEKRSSSDYYLVITQSKLSNGGAYECRGNAGGSKTFTLDIQCKYGIR